MAARQPPVDKRARSADAHILAGALPLHSTLLLVDEVLTKENEEHHGECGHKPDRRTEDNILQRAQRNVICSKRTPDHTSIA